MIKLPTNQTNQTNTNIAVYLYGYGDLQSEISLLYKHQLKRTTFEFSHAGHGAVGGKWLCLGHTGCLNHQSTFWIALCTEWSAVL